MEIINKDNESDDESFNKIYDEDEEEGKIIYIVYNNIYHNYKIPFYIINITREK